MKFQPSSLHSVKPVVGCSALLDVVVLAGLSGQASWLTGRLAAWFGRGGQFDRVVFLLERVMVAHGRRTLVIQQFSL